MMRSLFAGVSGLQSHQTMTDIVANNIANVNTVGFKASRVQFADTLSQLLQGSSGSGEATAGTNPQQVGLGVSIASTNRVFTQGGSQLTGRPTDVAIQGDGFFSVNLGTQQLYTRAGSFSFDDAGFLTDPKGGVVQGWVADTNGAINLNSPIQGVQVPVNATVPPVITTEVTIRGNLDVTTAVAGQQGTAIDVVDSLGQSRRMDIDFTKTAPNVWDMTLTDSLGTVLGTAAITFDGTTGLLVGPAAPTYTYTPPAGTAFTFAVELGTAGTTDALTQFAGSPSAQAIDQNGLEIGNLRSFAIGNDGTLTAVFSNGQTSVLAQVAIATFSNPAGLLGAGDSRFRGTNASGTAIIGPPGIAGRGTLAAGTLEMSNVDLAEAFTALIISQRGFQANSRVITVSDEMIAELVNLKR
ncbi:MAG: flagellar hook protein FlgE [Acidimicrobiales bacterium]